MLGMLASLAVAAPPVVEIRDRELVIDGHALARPWATDAIFAALGPPDRVEHGFNAVSLYDRHGIGIFTDDPPTYVREVQLCHTRDAEDRFRARRRFDGTFRLESLTLGRRVAIEDVARAAPAYAFTQTDFSDGYRGEQDGLYVYVNYAKRRKIDCYSFGLTATVW